MTESPRIERVLPPDLQDIERVLRAEPAPPPATLLSRITASRELGVVVERMLLAEETAWTRRQQRRTALSAAAAIVLLAGSFAAWRVGKVADQSPSVPATTSIRPSVTGAEPFTPSASITRRLPPPGNDFARLLTPWPGEARAQLPSALDRRYARASTLVPQFKGNVYNERRRFVRTLVAADGRLSGMTSIVWDLTNVRWTDPDYAPTLIARRFADSTDIPTEVDSIVLGRELNLWQRRLHRGSVARFFLFSEAHRWVQVADTAALLAYPNSDLGFGVKERLWNGVPVRYFRKLSGRHALVVSEAHLALLLRTVPLWDGWETSVGIPTSFNYIAPKYDEGIMHLRVTSLDTLSTQIGTVTAYRVQLDYGTGVDFWWIDRRDGGLVQSMRPLENGAWEIGRVQRVTRPRAAKP